MSSAPSTVPTPATVAPRRFGWKSRVGAALVIIALIILILLLRTCRTVPFTLFDYFRDKAGELKNDPSAVVAFVRDKVATLPYRGDVKGPLATLWNGAGSPEEKVKLATAILAYCKPVRTAALDDVAPTRDKATDTSTDAKGPPFGLKVVHRVIRASDADETAPVDTVVYDGPIGDLVGDVHTIEASAPGQTKVTIRGRSAASKTIDLPADAVAEQIVFTYRLPALLTGGAAPQPAGDAAAGDAPPAPAPIVTVRELWHTGNGTGANHAELKDRHDFVVLPGRVDQFVRDKEEVILDQRQRKNAPERSAYLMLLEYAVQSDRMLASLEKHRHVTALFDQPRVLMASQFVAPEMTDGVAWALDLRADATRFDAPGPADAYLATAARSFMESGLEQKFLAQHTGKPSTSTFDVFTRMKDDYPNTCARRLTTIRRALEDLHSFSAVGASATFAVHAGGHPKNGKPPPQPPSVTVTRAADGALHLKSGPVRDGFAQHLAATPDAVRIPVVGRSFEGDFTDDEALAVAVETSLLAADVSPAVSPDYVLDVRLDRGAEPLVEPGAHFVFAWGEGEGRTDQRIDVESCEADLALKWRVQTSALPAAGHRDVKAKALEAATTHNPWYRAGTSVQDDATSFCVSRKVYESIKAGRPIDLAVQARRSSADDELARRPVEFTAPLTPVGRATKQVTINGKPESIPVIQCTLRGQPVAILDDASFPIGMADRLTRVVTDVRCRLVDETGVPIGAAEVTVRAQEVDGEAEEQRVARRVTTASDGSFRLPPPADLEGPHSTYGKAAIRVKVGDLETIDMTADLTAPGLSTVEIKVKRPRVNLVYVTPSNPDALDGAAVSDQVKRNARRDLAAGRAVVIPSRMADDGVNKSIGYYAWDRASGSMVGVTEDGLNGSNAWRQAALTAAEATKKARKELLESPQAGASAPFHMYRGALISWWTYAGDRLAGDNHVQALIDTLGAMEGWSSALNMSTSLSRALGSALGDSAAADKLNAKLTGEFVSLINSGIAQAEGDSATAVFEVGYISGCAGLANLIGDEDYDLD